MTNKEKMRRIRDYADCADASYAMLHYVVESVDSIFTSKIWKGNDNVKLGDRIKENITDSNGNILHKENSNTAYARCIEARFMKDVALEKGVFKDTTIDNNPIIFLLIPPSPLALKTLSIAMS